MYEKHLERYLENKQDLDKNLCIRRLGFVRNIGDAYRDSDIFAYCSSLDALPNVLLEAQIYGLPTIVNAYGSFTDLIIDGFNGLVFAKDNYEDFAAKFNMLTSDSTLRGVLSKNSMNHVCQNYSVDHIGKMLEEGLVEALLERPSWRKV
jgi:glycosyltransferase involved in cell wall biosynthesis